MVRETTVFLCINGAGFLPWTLCWNLEREAKFWQHLSVNIESDCPYVQIRDVTTSVLWISSFHMFFCSVNNPVHVLKVNSTEASDIDMARFKAWTCPPLIVTPFCTKESLPDFQGTLACFCPQTPWKMNHLCWLNPRVYPVIHPRLSTKWSNQKQRQWCDVAS